jgi:hypothetical protein
MKIHSVSLALAGVASLAMLSSHAPVGEGAKVEYKFRSAPVNALGIASMADLRGKPVMIDFWGKN